MPQIIWCRPIIPSFPADNLFLRGWHHFFVFLLDDWRSTIIIQTVIYKKKESGLSADKTREGSAYCMTDIEVNVHQNRLYLNPILDGVRAHPILDGGAKKPPC